MTVARYRQMLSGEAEADSFAYFLAENVDVWDNDACRGYVVKAMQAAGFDNDAIRNVLREFHDVFDLVSVDEAAAAYIDFR